MVIPLKNNKTGNTVKIVRQQMRFQAPVSRLFYPIFESVSNLENAS